MENGYIDRINLWFNWMILVGLIISSAANSDNVAETSPIDYNDRCTSRICEKENIQFELTIQRNINISVDPCEDFYQFACGNFDNASTNPLYSDHNDFFKPIRDREKKIRQLLKKRNFSHPHKPFNYLKNFMQSCKRLKNNFNKNLTAINNLTNSKSDSLDFLIEIISKLGEWPVVNGSDWNNANFNWIDFTKQSEIIGIKEYFFYKTSVVLNHNTRALSISPPTLEFTHSYLKTDRKIRKVNAYLSYMIKVAQFLGAEHQNALIELTQVLKFELDLISASNVSSTTTPNTKMTIGEMVTKWPTIKWIEVFYSFIESNYSITTDSIVFVENPDYIDQLIRLVDNTSKNVQANYAIWKTINSLVSYTESPFLFNAQLSYYSVKFPTSKITGYDCFSLLVDALPELALSYYERYNPIDRKVIREVKQIIESIKTSFHKSLQKLSWLDATTKNKIVVNLNSTKFVLGLTETMFDDKKLNAYYEGLKVTNNNFLKNYLNIASFNNRKFLSEISKPRNLIDPTIVFRSMNPFTTINNAFYKDYIETVFLDSEALRNLFFGIHRPRFTKYSIIGFTISHELGHSIEYVHGIFNENGIIENGWTNFSNTNYGIRKQCLIDQYQNYTENGENDTTRATSHIEEDIADNIGLSIAYSAYEDWVENHEGEKGFPSLPYTPNQLFWLSYVNKWCIPKSIPGFVYSKNSHATLDLRVLGTLSNSQKFADDFNCASGSRMNPKKKCHFLQ